MKRIALLRRALLVLGLLLLGLGAGALPAAAGTTQVSADFDIYNLVVPAEAGIGEKITISLTVKNKATVDGDYEGILLINGVKQASKAINVPPKGEKQLSFSVAMDAVGTYSVDVDGLKGSFAVTESRTAALTAGGGGFPVLPVAGGAAAVVVVGLVVFFLMRRQRARPQSA